MQRAGGVGGDKFHQHLLAVGRLLAEAGLRGQHFAHHRLAGGRREAQVDEAGAGDLQRRDPALHRGLGLQGGHQRGGQIARVALGGAGELHRGGDGEIAMRGLLGGLEAGHQRGLGRHLGDGRGQGLQQLLLGLDHGRGFYVRGWQRPRRGRRLQAVPLWRPECTLWCAGAASQCPGSPRQDDRHHAARPRPQHRPRPARADRQVPGAAAPGRRRHERGVPRPRRLPRPPGGDQARARAALGWRRHRGALQPALLRRRGRVGGPAAAPERGADLRRGGRRHAPVPGDGVRARRHAAPLLPRRRAAAAGAGGGNRLQVRDGAGLRVQAGADPPRREACQHPGGDGPRARHRREDQRLRQRAEPRLRPDAGVPRGLAGLHVARATRRQHARCAGRHVLAGRGAVPPGVGPPALRRGGPARADEPDLQRHPAAADGSARRRAGAAGRDPAARAGQEPGRPLPELGRLRAGLVVAGGAGRRAARPAARRAGFRALQPAAHAGVLRRLRRRGAVGGGAPRQVAAAPFRRIALPQGPGRAHLPHHRHRPGGGAPRGRARGPVGRRHLGGRDGVPGAQPRPAHPQRRRGGVGARHHHLVHAAVAGTAQPHHAPPVRRGLHPRAGAPAARRARGAGAPAAHSLGFWLCTGRRARALCVSRREAGSVPIVPGTMPPQGNNPRGRRTR